MRKRLASTTTNVWLLLVVSRPSSDSLPYPANYSTENNTHNNVDTSINQLNQVANSLISDTDALLLNPISYYTTLQLARLGFTVNWVHAVLSGSQRISLKKEGLASLSGVCSSACL
ncbi:hypothetical protein F4824DRAFT_458589, partial [Ustulina deusta]